MPDREKFKPAGICRRNVNQSELMSPDQAATPFRCDPANADRERMKTRFWSEAARAYLTVIARDPDAVRKALKPRPNPAP